MTKPKDNLSRTCLKRNRTAALVRLTVSMPIAISRDRSVGFINDGEMHDLLISVSFIRRLKTLSSRVSFAASHPTQRLTFAKHDGVKRQTIQRLHADRSSALLLKVIESQRNFQSLRLQRHLQRSSRDELLPTVHSQCPVL